MYFTLPTIRFIKDKKDISNNWTEIERLKVNNILRNKFNDVVDLSNFDQDEYFKKDGKTYNLNAHLTLYKLLFRKIRNYDPTAKVKTRITDISCDITKIQKKLLSLNFDINTSEIAKSQYGPSTRAAVNIIRKKLGYTPSEELTKNLCNAIMLLEPQDNIIPIIDKRKKCPDPRPKARLKYDPKDYDGINGSALEYELGRAFDSSFDPIRLYVDTTASITANTFQVKVDQIQGYQHILDDFDPTLPGGPDLDDYRHEHPRYPKLTRLTDSRTETDGVFPTATAFFCQYYQF